MKRHRTLNGLKRLALFYEDKACEKERNKITEKDLLRSRNITRKIDKRAHTRKAQRRKQNTDYSLCFVVKLFHTHN